jgi:hypothetical protein
VRELFNRLIQPALKYNYNNMQGDPRQQALY